METQTSNGASSTTVNIGSVVTETSAALRKVLTDYAIPDPKIVSTLPKGGIKLDFVGHADITRILIEVDPMWYWEPIKFDDDGLPAYRVENGMAHMAGRLCLLGVERVAIGSAEHNKRDLLKELVSDFLRNGAMRFGISLNLWTKSEWEDLNHAPATEKPKLRPATPKPAPAEAPSQNVSSADAPLTDEQIEALTQACKTAGVNPLTVYKNAGIKFGFATQKDLASLRAAFADEKAKKAQEKEAE